MVVDSEILSGGAHSMVVFRDSIQRWDPPHEREPVSDADRDRVIADISRFVRSKGYAEIEVV